MFIRVKKNQGGSQSVMLVVGERVPGKKYSVSRMIKNFGAAYNDEDLAKLKAEALDFKTKLEAESPNKYITLKIAKSSDLRSCKSYVCGFNDVYGNMFDKFFSNLPLKPHQLTKLKKLITLRIATPASKLRTSCLASDYGIDLKVDSIYKLMDELDDNKIKLIKNSVYENSTKLLSEQKMEANVLFYDLTTLYFETNNETVQRTVS